MLTVTIPVGVHGKKPDGRGGDLDLKTLPHAAREIASHSLAMTMWVL
jgi:hypothetical protein